VQPFVLGHLSCENGSINISGCDLVVSNDSILSGQHSSVSLVQEGGTNRISSLSMSGPVVGGSPVNYSMNSGWLCTSNVGIGSRGTFSQIGGSHIVTNTLQIFGSGRYFPVAPYFANYEAGGILSARFIQMNELSRLLIYGTAKISESLQLSEVHFT
jgi:hypothetical protein